MLYVQLAQHIVLLALRSSPEEVHSPARAPVPSPRRHGVYSSTRATGQTWAAHQSLSVARGCTCGWWALVSGKLGTAPTFLRVAAKEEEGGGGTFADVFALISPYLAPIKRQAKDDNHVKCTKRPGNDGPGRLLNLLKCPSLVWLGDQTSWETEASGTTVLSSAHPPRTEEN